MDWFTDLFTQHSAIQAVVVLSLISVFGMMLGKVRFFGISLGVTFVFFIGIAAGHFGLSVDPSMLAFAESFGLVLFVYALGLQVGPGFFSSLRSGGIRLVSLATLIVLTGSALAVGLGYAARVPMSDMAGILCGATTNTPALGAAQQMLSQMQLDCNNATLGCALTYPLGVVGVILGIIAVRKLFARPSDIPQPDAEHKRISSSSNSRFPTPASSAKASATSRHTATTISSSPAFGVPGRFRFRPRTRPSNRAIWYW